MRLETLKDKSRFEKAIQDVKRDILYTHHLEHCFMYNNKDGFEEENKKEELVQMWKDAKTSKEFIQELVMKNIAIFDDVCWSTKRKDVLDFACSYCEDIGDGFDKEYAEQNIECFIGGVYVLFGYSDYWKESKN